MKTTATTTVRREAEKERAYQEHIARRTDELLLSLRAGAWTKVSAVAAWLAPRIEGQYSVHRYLKEGGTHDPKLSRKAEEGQRLILGDILGSLRERKLLAFRKAEDGEEEVQVTPLVDPRFTIDPEFASLLPRAPDEVKKLEERLLVEEPRDPLVVWKGKRLLVDGHTRQAFLSLLGRDYSVVEMEFRDRQAVITWIFNTHYGRRNYSAEMKAYVRGKQYLARKQQHGGDRKKSSGQSVHLKTANAVAVEYGIDGRTVRRDAIFAGSLDKIAEICGDELRQHVLSRVVKWTKRDVERLAKLERAAIQKIVRVALDQKKRPKLLSPKGDGTTAGKPVILPKEQPRVQVQALSKFLGRERLARLYKALGQFLKQGGLS